MGEFIPLSYVIRDWPDDIIAMPAVLDDVGVSSLTVSTQSDSQFVVQGNLLVDQVVAFEVAFIPGLSIALLYNGTLTEFEFALAYVRGRFYLDLKGLGGSLIFDSGLLRSVDAAGTDPHGETIYIDKVDPITGDPVPLQVDFAGVDLSLDSSGNFDFTFAAGAPTLSVPAFTVGGTGIVVEIDSFSLVLSETAAAALPASLGPTARGVWLDQARIHLPEGLSGVLPDDVVLEDFFIGAGGLSGTVAGAWEVTVAGGELTGGSVGTLLGFDFGLTRVALEFKQNALVASEIAGLLHLPFFDSPLGVDISLGGNGELSVTLSAQQPAGLGYDSAGLLEITKPGLLTLKLESLALHKTENTAAITLSGSVKPEFRAGEIEWPEVGISGLTIDTSGKVTIEGGWIDLPEVKALDLFGFHADLERIGFGNEDDGSRWVGFSGGVELFEAIPIRGSVEGLRVIWGDAGPVRLKLDGIGLGFDVPGTLEVDGSVAFIEEGSGASLIQGFRGGVTLALLPLDLRIDAQVVIAKAAALGLPGADATLKSLYVFLALEAPVGVPLFQTGLALFGLAGLFGHNMAPGKSASEDWYDGWYKSAPEGVTAAAKWSPSVGGLAIGAGLTVGVLPNGYPFSAKGLFVVTLPGPLIMVEGKAQFLRPRADLSGDDALFTTLLIIDPAAGYFLFNVGAEYVFPESGPTRGLVIDITAGAEAFFDLGNLTGWHLYLGERPKDKRLRADILGPFSADAYLMLESTGVAMGAWVGYEEDWKFGPVSVYLGAWLEGEAEVSWKPAQFWGRMALEGGVEVKACGITMGLWAGADMELSTPTPFYLGASVHVTVELPWPVKDFETTLELVWEQPGDPPLPLPLHGVALEHLKVSEKWPLTLYPAFDMGNPGFYVGASGTEPDYAESPMVPPDARMVLSFAKPVEDVPKIGDNYTMPTVESVDDGDFEYAYSLESLTLEKRVGSAWQAIDTELYGAWQFAPGGDPQNTTVMLWSRTPFDYAREIDNQLGWATAIHAQWDAHPCDYPTEPATVCVNFSSFAVGAAPLPVFGLDGVVFVGEFGPVELFQASVCDTSKKLPTVGDTTREIYLPEPVAEVHLCIREYAENLHQYVDVQGAQGRLFVYELVDRGEQRIILRARHPEDPIAWLRIWGASIDLLQVCYVTVAAKLQARRTVAQIEHLASTTAEHWSGEDVLLEPHTHYKLTVTTSVNRTARKGDDRKETMQQWAYFQTGGPPGFLTGGTSGGELLPAAGGERYPEKGPLRDLSLYVSRTIPAVGAPFHYRAYDVGVEFNESYVEQMFLMAGDPLRIKLYDNNGDPVTGADGQVIELDNEWGDNPERNLTVAEAAYVALAAAEECFDVDYTALPPDQALAAHLGDAPLRAATNYRAVLVSGACEPYSFAFTTSRFLSFRDQVEASFSGRLWDHYELSGSPAELVPPASLAAVQSLVGGLGPVLVDDGGTAFAELSDLLELGYRVTPECFEVTLVRDARRSYGLLLESPEPLDWQRTSLRLAITDRAWAATLGTITVIPNADGARTFVFLNDSGGAKLLPDGQYRLTFTFRRDIGPAAPILTQNGATDPEEAVVEFLVEPRYRA